MLKKLSEEKKEKLVKNKISIIKDFKLLYIVNLLKLNIIKQLNFKKLCLE